MKASSFLIGLVAFASLAIFLFAGCATSSGGLGIPQPKNTAIVAPAPDLPAEKSAFLGWWECLGMVPEGGAAIFLASKVDQDGVSGEYCKGAGGRYDPPAGCQEFKGEFQQEGGRLILTAYAEKGSLKFFLKSKETMEAELLTRAGTRSGIFKKKSSGEKGK